MSYEEVLSTCRVAISASESPDMDALGLSVQHLRDGMVETARHLLALGADLVYSGDLRTGGFSELLFELVQRHRRDLSVEDSGTGVTNYLAWPVHLRMTFADIRSAIEDLGGAAEIICLDEAAIPVTLDRREQIPSREPSDREWTSGLTAMRSLVTKATRARIVFGGAVSDYRGAMPGISEEVLLSLESRAPIFLLGGFGGCARDIAEAMGLVDPWAPLNRKWRGLDRFAPYQGPSHLNNGLSELENQVLARTPHIDQAIVLILKGLTTIDRQNYGELPLPRN